jgi:hypothetical protein
VDAAGVILAAGGTAPAELDPEGVAILLKIAQPMIHVSPTRARAVVLADDQILLVARQGPELVFLLFKKL